MNLGHDPFSTEVYLSPVFMYGLGTLAGCYIYEPLTSQRLTDLYDIVLVQSHLEQIYSCAFRYRVLIREFLEAKMYNAEAILGTLLCNRMPIGVTSKELFDLYQLFVTDVAE